MASPNNPYSPPGSAVADVQEVTGETLFAVPGVKVDAGRGASWIGEGWALFKAAPLLWIVALVLLSVLQMVLGLIPLLGAIAQVLLGPVFMLGVLAFARGIAEGGQPDISNLFAGFREKLGPLAMVGLLYFLMILGVIAVFIGSLVALAGGAASINPDDVVESMGTFMAGDGMIAFLIALLLAMGLGILVAAAYWFAPGLVYYTDLGAWDAMKESFRTCMRNWLPFLVYGILGLLVIVAGMITLFIGLFLVSLPVLMASYYSSFSDLFGKKA
jgi:uncharacterized membrane protein